MAPFVPLLFYYCSCLVKPSGRMEGAGGGKQNQTLCLQVKEDLLCVSLSFNLCVPVFFFFQYTTLPVWIGLFSTSFILFVSVFSLVSKNWKMQMSGTLQLRNGEGVDRWMLHALLWSTSMKWCCFICGVTWSFVRGLLTWKALEICLSR